MPQCTAIAARTRAQCRKQAAPGGELCTQHARCAAAAAVSPQRRVCTDIDDAPEPPVEASEQEPDECPICFETMGTAERASAVPECGHAMCVPCLLQHCANGMEKISKGPECPLCHRVYTRQEVLFIGKAASTEPPTEAEQCASKIIARNVEALIAKHQLLIRKGDADPDAAMCIFKARTWLVYHGMVEDNRADAKPALENCAKRHAVVFLPGHPQYNSTRK